MSPSHAKHPARVLVIDDEKGVRDLFSSMLGRQGHQVTTAADGAAALHYAVSRELDVVFCDLMLPGMSGFAVLTELRKKRAALPVVVMSGYPTEEIRSGSILLGAFAFLPKPFDLRPVEVLIARAMAGRSAG